MIDICVAARVARRQVALEVICVIRSASRSEALTVAVGFSPRVGANEEQRRGATHEVSSPAIKRRYATLAPPALIRGLKPTATFIRSLRDPTAVRLWEFRDETPHFAAATLAPPILWIVA